MLLDPAVRADAAAVDRLLHPEFFEFGRSRRLWDRAGVLAALAADPGVDGTPAGFVPVRVSDDVVLVTFRSQDGTRRSSLWVYDADLGWVMRFHQGTPAPPRHGPASTDGEPAP